MDNYWTTMFLELPTFAWFEILLTLLMVFLLFRVCFGRYHLPPGPWGIPIFGYLPFLGTEAYRTFHKLSDKYGPIFSIRLGRKLVVVLGNFKVVREALSNSDILDRPEKPPNHLLPDSTSLSVSNGKEWKEQRQFSIQTLRHLGMGKVEMESIIQGELDRLLNAIDSREGRPMNLDAVILPSVSNTMLRLLSGRAPDFGDEERLFLNRMLQTMTVFFRPTRCHAYFPSLRSWMARFKLWGYHRAESCMAELSHYIERIIFNREMIREHKRTLDQHSMRDYIDSYLLALKSANESSSFSERMLKGNFQSLLSAGSTPSRATVEWALLTMVQHPGVQEAVHEELDRVLGESDPTWEDHLDLPYTMAVVYEVMRHNSIVPIAMLRCTSKDTKIAGYDIPKGSIVMPNIWGVHHDPEYWEDPYVFKPERFLKDGKVFKPPEFIPFSYGKRNCPGEDMAVIEVFLYFSTLMKRYKIDLPDGESTVKQVLGVAKLIILDNVCMKLRR